MTPFLIDSHCHIHFPPYDTDRADVLLRMKSKGIWGITVGTTIGTSKSAVEFADKTDGVWAAVGYHPEHFTSTYHDEAEGDADIYSIEELEKVARSSKKVVAIGETGLDFFRMDEGTDIAAGKEKQERGLREQIALARRLELPVIIHCRDALTRLAEIIQDEQTTNGPVRGVVHCFTGTWAEAKPLLDLGLHLSFTGIITFPPKKSQDPETLVQRVIERMPLEQMLVETDSPYLTPVPHRGERNEPAYVEFVAQKIAELRKIDLETIAKQTTENTRRLFKV
ncbi:MAG: TatD family hydrolase [Patescibacteria group bacterium]